MAYDTAAYAGGDCGPGKLAGNIADIQASGLTTLILWALHIGRPSISGQHYGDFIFNDGANLFISQGAFNPLGTAAIAAWPGQIARLRQQGSVGKVYFSIGGASPPVFDFTTVQYMLNNGMTDVLSDNVAALKQAFTVNGSCVIDGFDLDCEENVDPSTIVALSQIFFDQGFEVSFCPYTNQDFWQGCMQTLWNKGLKVSRWNLWDLQFPQLGLNSRARSQPRKSHATTRHIALTLAALALAACASRNEVPVSSLGEDDDAICRANNVAVGSSDYVACRKNRDVQRGNAAAKADRAQRNLSETMINTPYKP